MKSKSPALSFPVPVAVLASVAALVAGCASTPEATQPQQEARCVPVDAPTGSNIAVRRTVCKDAKS